MYRRTIEGELGQINLVALGNDWDIGRLRRLIRQLELRNIASDDGARAAMDAILARPSLRRRGNQVDADGLQDRATGKADG